ncbi:MAG TPA: Spy/CpxP family protein refolding chaperone [Phenylobacterium sp.]|uniref:Spy/CpxP family protein refolding chaperone n=1 Tax=Phenylobacterium sp. TaxID=1871053 RepID=UPI002BA6C23F|nr:Spy/CpxP family protein refolding chaperone [Phenylobacterium sp.]HXA38112.1 Spy/CpxP family protein refolding chaperone [Phenylobacterium sp.]
MRPILRQAALTALAALGAASIAAPAAWAQDDSRGQRPTPDQIHARMRQMREAHERQRAADLRTILRLRPDQEPALAAFLQSHERPGGPGEPGERRGPPGEAPTAMAMTTPQRLDEMARRDAQREALHNRRAEALRTFYAALSPEQRQVFDALQRMHGGHEHGGFGRRGFAGPHGPMGGSGGSPPRDE